MTKKDKAFANNIFRLYGVTWERYLEMSRHQGGKCFICKKINTISGRRLSVDHCHKTGKIRGLLCYKCNTAIGLLDDCKKLARKAYKYLCLFSAD